MQVCGFVASLHVLIFAVIGHNKHPFDISSVHGFPGHAVRLDFFDSICWRFWFKFQWHVFQIV